MKTNFLISTNTNATTKIEESFAICTIVVAHIKEDTERVSVPN